MAWMSKDGGALGGSGATVLEPAADGKIHFPSGDFLYSATFVHSGSDLKLVGHDGHTVIVPRYFESATPLPLVAPNDTLLNGDTVRLLAGPAHPAQYAQAGSPSAPSPIGKVEQGDGTSSIQHADGTAGLLKVGDPIFENDVVETKTSALGIRFEDGTLFSMSAGARMVINHFVYDANGSSNSALFSVVKGTFSMFGGKVVDTGDMRVETPIATLGIRGSSGVCVAVDGANGRCTAVPDPDGSPSKLDVLNPQTGELVGTLTDVFSKVILTPQGVLIAPQTAAEIGEAKNLAQILYRLYGYHTPHSPPEFDDPQVLKKILFDLDDFTFFQLLPSLVFIPFPVLEQVVIEFQGFQITTIEPVITEVNEVTAAAVTTETIPVPVDAVAQQPTLTVGDASGDEDTAIPLVISSALTDTDGSESLAINISGLPEGATLNQGTLNPDGSYTLTPAQLAGLTITPPDDSDADFILTVTATSTEADGGGTSTNIGTINLTVTDAVPTAVDDEERTVAEDAAAINGNVLTNDTQGADGAILTHVKLPGSASFVAITSVTETSLGSGVYQHTTAVGIYTFAANGNWTFDPALNQDQDPSDVDASFTYRITDGDNDTSTAVQPITVTDGAVPTAGDPISLTVDDENLADGTTPLGPNSDAGTVSFTAGSDALTTFAFAPGTGALGGGLTWNRVSDVLIEGWDGPVGTGTKFVTLTLTPPASIAVGATGTVTVTATLLDNYDSHPGIVDDLQNLGSVTVIASDQDGNSATGTVNVSVSDDIPVAVDNTVEGTIQTVDIQFIVDMSGSMFPNTGTLAFVVPGFDSDRAGLARYSMLQMLQSNLQIQNVEFVRFGTSATGSVWMTRADAIAFIQADGNWTDLGSTNYDLALQTAISTYDGARPLPESDQTFVYFVSDGAPNDGGGITGTGTTPLADGVVTITDWENHVTSQGIDNVFAIGIGSGVSVSNLEPVAYPNTGAAAPIGDEDHVVIVNTADVNVLLNTLQNLLDASSSINGNVLLNDPSSSTGADGFGADGGRILSIEINGITYEWNGTNVIDPTGLGANIPGNQLTNILTSKGGKLSFNFTTGDWSYTAPAGGVTQDETETFRYVIVDGDGDTATANLVVTVINADAADPIVLDLGAPGLEFSSLGYGVQFDINADGLLDHVAWTASVDGILAYDLDLSGIIENGTELFTPQFAGGSHADGLAALASLDSNNDGVIDASDAAFGKLVVWQDANHDGVSDPGELKSLSALGITGIDLGAADSNATIDGQAILAEGSFTYADGTTGTFVEVEFDATLGNAEVTNDDAYDDGIGAEREADNRNINAAVLAASVGFGVATAAASAAIAAPIQLDDTGAVPADGSDTTATGLATDGSAGTGDTPVVDPLHGTPGDDATPDAGNAVTTDGDASAQGLAPVDSDAAQPSSTLAASPAEVDDKAVTLITPEGQVTGATVAGEDAHAEHSDAASSADDKHVPSSGASFEESKAEPLPEVKSLTDHDTPAVSDAGLPASALPAGLAERLAAVTSLDTNNDGLVDHNDASYSKLAVWQDANNDGVADPSELSSLADHGIEGIALNGSMIDGYLDAHSLLAQAPPFGTPLVAVQGADAQWAKLASLDIGDLLVGGDNYIDIDQALKASALTNAQPEGGAGSSASGPEASASQAAASSPEAAAQAADAPPPANDASGDAAGGEQSGQQNQSQDAKGNDGPAEAGAGPNHAEAASVSVSVDDGAEQAQNHAVA